MKTIAFDLRHVEVPVMKMEDCVKAKFEPYLPVTPKKNICAGGVKGKYFLK